MQCRAYSQVHSRQRLFCCIAKKYWDKCRNTVTDTIGIDIGRTLSIVIGDTVEIIVGIKVSNTVSNDISLPMGKDDVTQPKTQWN